MADTVTVKEGYEASARTYGRHYFEETINLTTSFKNVLLIDARRLRGSAIVFNNVGTGGGNTADLNYQIYAATKPIHGVLKHVKDPTNAAVNKDNPEWVNLLSIIGGSTGITYDHDSLLQLNNTKRFYQSFANDWFAVLIRAQSITTTTDLSIWHRGQS